MDFKHFHLSDEHVIPPATPSPRSPGPVEDKKEDGVSSAFKFKRRTSIEVNPQGTGAEKAEVFSLAHSSDNRFLAAGCSDGSIRVFNSVGRLSYSMNIGGTNKLPTTCVKFRPPNQASKANTILLVANADGTVSHWHMTSQKCLYTIEERDNQVYTVDYSPDGEKFATAGRDAKIRIYEENTKMLQHTLTGGQSKKSNGHSNRIYAVKYKADEPNILLSGGWDNTVQIWDTRIGQSIRSIFGPHICGDALDVRGEQILTGSWRPDDALQLWDFGTGKLINTIPWTRKAAADAPKEPEMLYAAAFSPDGQFIAAGGCGTNEGKVFDVNNEYKVVDRQYMGEKGVYALSFAPNGRKLAFAGGSLNISVVDLA